MSSKRHVKQRICTRKHRHATEQEAQHEANRLYRLDGRKTEAYHCDFCQGWHAGRRDINQSYPHGAKFAA